MSVLTKNEILHYIKEEKLVFTPKLDQFQLQPHAVDLRLGFYFSIPQQWYLDETGRRALNIDYLQGNKNNGFQEVHLKRGQFFEILPQETIIAKTLEKISLNHSSLMAILFPKSSLNRKGLALDLSGIVDANYSGHLIIPLKNNTSQIIKLYPGERICQLIFEELASPLSPEEAHSHGLAKAKYSDSLNHYFISDPKDETDLVGAGKLEELKQKFPLEESSENLSLELESKENKTTSKPPADYPYLPQGKTIEYIDEENFFMNSAKKLLISSGCTKQPTGAVVELNGKIVGRGTNAELQVSPCPKTVAGYKAGEGYHLCKEKCLQKGYAEVVAIKDAKRHHEDLTGANIYIYGHWWCCKDSWDVMIKENINKVYLVNKAWEIFKK